MVDVDPGPGEAASGFGYWGGAVGAVGYFAGVLIDETIRLPGGSVVLNKLNIFSAS